MFLDSYTFKVFLILKGAGDYSFNQQNRGANSPLSPKYVS